MQFGVQLHPELGADAVIREAQQADALGYDSAWLYDHLMNWAGVQTAEFPLDSLTLAAAIGASTTRVRLSWAVLNLGSPGAGDDVLQWEVLPRQEFAFPACALPTPRAADLDRRRIGGHAEDRQGSCQRVGSTWQHAAGSGAASDLGAGLAASTHGHRKNVPHRRR